MAGISVALRPRSCKAVRSANLPFWFGCRSSSRGLPACFLLAFSLFRSGDRIELLLLVLSNRLAYRFCDLRLRGVIQFGDVFCDIHVIGQLRGGDRELDISV